MPDDTPADTAARKIGPLRWFDRPWRVVAGLAAVVVVPLVVALIALRGRHWSPVLDLAMTEFRVRDVGGRNTPLVGLPGRIGKAPEQGSHPGPLSFLLLAPSYRVFGSSAWAMEVGTVLIHLAAVVAALVLALRRGGTRLAVAVAVLLAVVLRGYGASVLSQPWNPYLPVVAWVVVLLALWSVLEGDAVGIVFFVVAGSLCSQTHVPYVALVGGLGVLTLGWIVARERLPRVRDSRYAVPMRGLRRSATVAGLVGFVLWLPPIIDQIRHRPGNLQMLAEYFTSTPEGQHPVGFGIGVEHLLRHLDVVRLGRLIVTDSGAFTERAFALDGSVVPGVLLLVVWAAAVVVAVRLGHRALVHLHAVIGAGFVLAAIAISRIYDKLWYYLTMWVWGLLALSIFAIGWTAMAWWRSAQPASALSTRRAVGWLAIVALVWSTLSFAWASADTRPPEAHLSDMLTAISDPTAAAIRDGVGAADGAQSRYVVQWSDAAYFGSLGMGLINELQRRGLAVYGPATCGIVCWRVPLTPQRVIDPTTATAEIQVATGSYIEDWRARDDAVEVVAFDPRTAAERAEFDSLRAEVISELTGLGLTDLITTVDENLFGIQTDPRVPENLQRIVRHMLELGVETAVFIAPAPH